ncbi:hypothetical protein MKX01_038052, partial [Papaver californicum]
MALTMHFNSVSDLFRSHFSKNGNINPANAKNLFRISSDSTTPKARFIVKRSETLDINQLERPLSKCYGYRYTFFGFEVFIFCLLELRNNLMGLEGSPIVVAQSEKFSRNGQDDSSSQQLSSYAKIEVVLNWFYHLTIDNPFSFRSISMEVIKISGEQVMDQILRLMLPRFMDQ